MIKILLILLLSVTANAVPPSTIGTATGVMKTTSGLVSSNASTSDLSEGSNLYYTSARFDTALATKSTTNLSEGSNLYYTTARFDTALATKSTTNLPEGSNLYFTDARAITAVTDNGLRLAATGGQPTCDSSNRGLMWNVEGGIGVADDFQVCQKTILDTYMWVTH